MKTLKLIIFAPLLLCQLTMLPVKPIKFTPTRQQKDESRKGTIRKYLWYAAGIIGPQLLAGMGFMSVEDANVYSVGTCLKAGGDLTSRESLSWLGEQAMWGAVAHEILQKDWLPIKKVMDATLNAGHNFLGKCTGNKLPADGNKLNLAIEIVLLGNVMKTLSEYW
jgi:hypothetical protein